MDRYRVAKVTMIDNENGHEGQNDDNCTPYVNGPYRFAIIIKKKKKKKKKTFS